MADFTQGDYGYTIIDNNGVSAQVVYKLKTSYEDIPKVVSHPESGKEYTVVSLEECFVDCESLITAPTIPDSVTNMRYCFMGCTSLTSAPVIPNGVTDIEGCFQVCELLTSAPVIPSSVTEMNLCFRGCTSLTSAPIIPDSVTTMQYCFEGCTSLTSAPIIPSSVIFISNCFLGCTSLTSAPIISSGVMNMTNCFKGCTSLTSAPTIPSSVWNMQSCFEGCTSLTNAPTIPDRVTKMDKCFKECSSLTGNIYVNNNAPNYTFIFDGTTGQTNDIYIIDNTQDKSVTTIWREIVAYTNKSKIHFEDDDYIPPKAILKLTRTDESGKASQTDTWVKIEIESQIYTDYIPIGWTDPTVVSEKFVLDSDIEFTPVGEGRERGPYNLEDGEQHTITYTINDGYRTTTVTATLSRVMALLDFLGTGGQDGYIDIPGMGMAIGTIATRNGLAIQFPTTIGDKLLPATKKTDVYTLTTDTEFDPEKEYYEKDGDNYVLTEDTEFIDGKYYENREAIDLDNYQLVIGRYNIKDEDKAFIIGNGKVEDEEIIRSNVLTVDWNGTVKLNGYNGREVGLLLSTDGVHQNSNIDVGWNYGNVDGASLSLNSVDFGSEGISEKVRGGFVLQARSEVGTKQLVGLTNGHLSWDGGFAPSTPIIQVKHISLGSQTVAANSTKSINLYAICNNAKPTGYKFIGLAGYSTNHGSIVMVSCRPTNSAYSFECRNLSSSQVTFTPEVFAMYIYTG